MIDVTLRGFSLAMALLLATAGVGFAADDAASDEKAPPVDGAPPTADGDDAAEPETPEGDGSGDQ